MPPACTAYACEATNEATRTEFAALQQALRTAASQFAQAGSQVPKEVLELPVDGRITKETAVAAQWVLTLIAQRLHWAFDPTLARVAWPTSGTTVQQWITHLARNAKVVRTYVTRALEGGRQPGLPAYAMVGTMVGGVLLFALLARWMAHKQDEAFEGPSYDITQKIPTTQPTTKPASDYGVTKPHGHYRWSPREDARARRLKKTEELPKQ